LDLRILVFSLDNIAVTKGPIFIFQVGITRTGLNPHVSWTWSVARFLPKNFFLGFDWLLRFSQPINKKPEEYLL